jgi:putative endonuclease
MVLNGRKLNQTVGAQGERWAQRYLKKKGYKIMTTNYRSPFGEIDIVCRQGHKIVFVEVKARSSDDFGGGLAAVTSTKQKRITQTALHYLRKFGGPQDEPTFGVMAITLGKDGPEGEFCEHAFEAAWGYG